MHHYDLSNNENVYYMEIKMHIIQQRGPKDIHGKPCLTDKTKSSVAPIALIQY